MSLPYDTTTTIIFAVFALAIVFLIFAVVHLNQKLKKFLVGNKVENFGDSISSISTSLDDLAKFRKDLEAYLTTVEDRLKHSVQAVYTVRFDPFKGTGSGGKQSFATAFINENGDGVVVSSLYAREHMSIFSKSIKNGTSEYELSTEEKEAVAGAMNSLKRT